MNNQFLVLLGAGSSCNYGFPLWKQVSELLKIQLDEFKNKGNQFASTVGINPEQWDAHITLVKQCVQDVDNGTYSTTDEAVTEYCKTVENSMIFNRVFWYTMARSFVNHINEEGNTDNPLDMVPRRYGENSRINRYTLEQFHIHYLFVKHKLLARQLKTAMFVDYNYDGLFEYCYRYQSYHGRYKQEGAKVYSDMHLHKLKQKKLDIDRQIDMIKKLRASKVEFKPEPPPEYPDQYLLNRERMKKKFGIDNSYDALVVRPRENKDPIRRIRGEENTLSNLQQEYNALKLQMPTSDLNYFQPHGSFFLNLGLREPSEKGIWRDNMPIASWIDTQEIEISKRKESEQKFWEQLPHYFPASCHDEIGDRFTAINEQIDQSKPSYLLILGISPIALEQNTKHIHFGDTIQKVYYTYFTQKQKSKLTNFISNKFPNAELYAFKTCTDLWQGLAQDNTQQQ